MTARTVLLAILVIAVVASGWLQFRETTDPERRTVSREGPDLFVDDMDLRLVDVDGRLRYHLTADRLDHYPVDDRAELVQPVMRVFEKGRTAWQIAAERGSIASGYETVWLLGAVEIERPATAGSRPLSIHTRDLLVKPDAQTAETVNTTRIRSDRFDVETTGLHADFGNDVLELKSRVRGRIDDAG